MRKLRKNIFAEQLYDLFAFFNYGPHVMPKRIAQIEITATRLNISALLESALTVGRAVEGAICHQRVTDAVEGALLVEAFVFDDLHFLSSVKCFRKMFFLSFQKRNKINI